MEDAEQSAATLSSSSEEDISVLQRVRSQNGYGVSDKNDGDTLPDSEPADPFLVNWDGGDEDPRSPRSFGKARKWIIVLIVSTSSLCVYDISNKHAATRPRATELTNADSWAFRTAASSIYTATYDQMEPTFGQSRIISVLGLSLFVLGIAFGPLCFSPLSEIYGRRPIYLVAWSMYLIWIIPQAVSRNIQTMLVGRFLCGFSGSTFLAVSGGTVGDLFAKHQLQYPMAIFSVSPFIGPCLGPLLGGFINYYADWRWTYYVLLVWAFVLLLAIVFLVPETYHPILLSRKARELRETTGDTRWKAAMELTERSIVRMISRSLMQPFKLLFFEPMCLNLCIFSAILLGILYLFFGAFPLVFTTHYGFNLWQVGLSFLGIGVGLIIGVLSDPIWLRIRIHLLSEHEKRTGKADASEPEFRLPPAIGGAILVPVGLFIFAWTTYPFIHWIVPIIGSCVFGTGTILVFTGIFTFLVDAYPNYAASALAANAFVRCVFAAAFPLFGNQMYTNLGFQWASSLLAFLTLAMMPFPYLFFKYGKRIRAKSRYARAI